MAKEDDILDDKSEGAPVQGVTGSPSRPGKVKFITVDEDGHLQTDIVTGGDITETERLIFGILLKMNSTMEMVLGELRKLNIYHANMNDFIVPNDGDNII